MSHLLCINWLNNMGCIKMKSCPAEGVKFDSGKLDWSLLPIEPVENVIRVLMYGANKYSPNNWLKVDDHERRYYNAAMRHLSAWQKGELTDEETGISHLAHATCCLLFLMGRSEEKYVSKE